MSDRPIEEVRTRLDDATAAARELGSTPPGLFMAMSILALEVIPSLKVTGLGQIDVDRFEQVRLWVARPREIDPRAHGILDALFEPVRSRHEQVLARDSRASWSSGLLIRKPADLEAGDDRVPLALEVAASHTHHASPRTRGYGARRRRPRKTNPATARSSNPKMPIAPA